MRLPVVRGLIDRRILVNYRVDADVLARTLPAPFRPQLVEGYGMVGICLIRLAQVRPAGWPAWLGLGSENAAHRAAVEWEENGTVRRGVYVRRRDTNAWFNVLAGGRAFPGVHHHAKFDVRETEYQLAVDMASDDGTVRVSVRGALSEAWPEDSIFPSLADASAFFQAGALGYSAGHSAGRFQGLELCCHAWQAAPLRVDEVQSSYFGDTSIFPAGSVQFDNALLMRGIEHRWEAHPDLCASAETALVGN